MTWIHNPFFHVKPDKPQPRADESIANGPPDSPIAGPSNGDVEAGEDGETAPLQRVLSVPIQPPTERLTGYQFFYIFILDGLGAFILSGGINFAIAYAMYTTQDTAAHPIRLFQLPNTLAGDAAVTIIVQNLITWMIELILVNRDLRSGHLPPIGFLPQPENKIARWFLFLDRGKQLSEPGSFGHWVLFLYSQLLRGFLVAVMTFPIFWAPSVGILTAVGKSSGGDWVFEKTWAPQVFKLLLGGVLSVVTTPLFAIFWLARCGWAMKTNERHYGER